MLVLAHWRVGLLTIFVLFGLFIVWGFDGCTVKNVFQGLRYSHQHYLSHSSEPNVSNQDLFPVSLDRNRTNETHVFVDVVSSEQPYKNINNETHVFVDVVSSEQPYKNINNETHVSVDVALSEKLDRNPKSFDFVKGYASWVSSELEVNLTSNLLARWLERGGEPCKDSKTVDIFVPGLDGGGLVDLSAGDIHEFVFQALDDSGKARCLGGDYFETDLSGELWKSRPLVKDFSNGSYSISLQVHPDFAGVYNLTVFLLYRHFEGLKFTPWKFVYNRMVRNIEIRFFKSDVLMPELQTCKAADFGKDVWCGRWTRHGKNDECFVGDDGRYRCLASDFPCKAPWCDGSLGILESNGWVYSAHCSFKMYSAQSAWKCLKNRWIFFWGDSNHVDTIRNMLNFILELPDVHSVPRRFDMNFSNPRHPSQTVRITSIFNGHWNETQNYLGVDSLRNKGFQNLLKKYFSEETIPDTVIINSGLHDGVHFSNIRAFSVGASYAAKFWAGILETVKQRGFALPRVFYRTTVATGGYARSLAFNPNKMDVFNAVFLDKLKQAGVVTGVIDNFDMTFPWHFDNRCNDGVHYGRAPAKLKWRDGQIGHQYFVDLMLAHVLLNALCAR